MYFSGIPAIAPFRESGASVTHRSVSKELGRMN